MTGTIIALAGGYALVLAVAAFLWLSTATALPLKIGLTLAVGVLVFSTYRGIEDIRGLPSDSAPPDRFRLHWAEVVEPDLMAGEQGSIFLWITALDENYYLVGQPRAYSLPYSDALADTIRQMTTAIADGEEIQGEVQGDAEEGETANDLAGEIGADPGAGGVAAPLGERFLSFDFGDLAFGAALGPVTPEKRD